MVLCEWITTLYYYEKLRLWKNPFFNYSLLITFGQWHFLFCVCVCVLTNSVLHTADLRTQAVSGIEIVGAGVKSGSLTSAEWLCSEASGLRYFLNGNPRLFLATFCMWCWRHCQGHHFIPPFSVTPSGWFACVWSDLCTSSFVLLRSSFPFCVSRYFSW